MTQTSVKFWEVTWGKLAPGDFVKAPNGTVWKIHAAIISDGAGEWCLVGADGASMWTPQKEATPVMAWRPPAGKPDPAGKARALEVLTAAFGELEVIE